VNFTSVSIDNGIRFACWTLARFHYLVRHHHRLNDYRGSSWLGDYSPDFLVTYECPPITPDPSRSFFVIQPPPQQTQWLVSSRKYALGSFSLEYRTEVQPRIVPAGSNLTTSLTPRAPARRRIDCNVQKLHLVSSLKGITFHPSCVGCYVFRIYLTDDRAVTFISFSDKPQKLCAKVTTTTSHYLSNVQSIVFRQFTKDHE